MRSDLLGRVAAGVAGVGLALALAAPAAAEEQQVSLDEADAGTVAADHRQRCAEGTDETDPRMADLGENEAGWHLQASDGEIESITVLFAADGGDADEEHVEITGTRGEETDPPGSPVIFAESGAYVFASAKLVLVTASAQVTDGGDLVVAYTCAPTPDEDVTDDGATGDGATGDAADAGGEGGEGGLPVTGAQVGGMLVIGFGLLSAGFAMTAVRRRRDIADLLGP